MDLIYTDKLRQDVGVLNGYTLDLAYGSDENNFELSIALNHHSCVADCLVYVEGTEYGGVIDGIGVVTKDETLLYKGRTWQGILGSKVIEPDPGEAYLTVSGEANQVIGELLDRMGLSNLFTASTEHSGLTIYDYPFDRYIDGYSGITKMLIGVSGKLKFTFTGGSVVVSALPIVDYSKDEQFDNDSVEMEVEQTQNTVNHLICLGKGELTERQVLHLYMDAKGNVTDTQTFFGIQEITKTYDCPNIESLDELRKSGVDKLKEYATKDKAQLNLTSEKNTYDIGDIIGAKEIITGIVANEKITKKIVTISQGEVNIQYKVGE